MFPLLSMYAIQYRHYLRYFALLYLSRSKFLLVSTKYIRVTSNSKSPHQPGSLKLLVWQTQPRGVTSSMLTFIAIIIIIIITVAYSTSQNWVSSSRDCQLISPSPRLGKLCPCPQVCTPYPVPVVYRLVRNSIFCFMLCSSWVEKGYLRKSLW